MGRIGLRYVTEDVDRHGNVRFYLRPPGARKIRLHGTPGTPEFARLYQDALAGRIDPPKARSTPAKPGTLYALATAYKGSPEFRHLAQSTRDMRRRLIDGLLSMPVTREKPDGPKLGEAEAAALTRAHLLKIRDRFADRPEAANNRIKALSHMFGWAVARDMLAANPCRDVRKIFTGSTGHKRWTADDVQKFRTRWPSGTMARMALEVLLTGVRRSDAVRLGRQHIDGGLIVFTAAKNESRRPIMVATAITPELSAEIAQMPGGRLTLIVTEAGHPFSAKGFGARMRRWCDAAGLKGLSAHGLRKTAATVAAERGASNRMLDSMFGWSQGGRTSTTYTRDASVKALATRAAPIAGLRAEGEHFVPLSPVAPKSGTKIRRK